MNPLAKDLDHVLAHTQGLWDELRGQRIFITGGTGFFGCWLLESLCWANDHLGLNTEAVVLTRDPEAFERRAPHLACHRAISLLVGDVREFDYPKGRFSHVIHAAAEASARLNSENPMLVYDIIVDGTRRTLDFACHCGATKFLLTSSGAVYGKESRKLGRIPEDCCSAPDASDPASAYGEGKRVAELLCAFYAARHSFEPKIARCFAFVGPRFPLDAHFAVGNFIRDAVRGGPVSVTSDGTPRRSYLHAADLVIWLWTILFRAPACRPYNVGSDEGISLLDLAHGIAQSVVPECAVVVTGRDSDPEKADSYVPCIDRARIELGLKVLIPLRDAIRDALAWHGRPPCSDAFGRECNRDLHMRG